MIIANKVDLVVFEGGTLISEDSEMFMLDSGMYPKEEWVEAAEGCIVGDVVNEDGTLATSQLAASAREQRDTLLAATDWTAMSDAPTQATAMTTYRQSLRDITSQSEWPTTIIWPTAP
jgi:hypothetical protein